MGRRRRDDEDAEIDARIGLRVALLRADRGWTQADLAARVDLSVPQLSALEAGQHGFSAALVHKLTRALGRPYHALYGGEPLADSLSAHWRNLYDVLSERDRQIVLELARRLVHWPETQVYQQTPGTRRSPLLVAIEGIDGVLMAEIADQLAPGLSGAAPAVYCPHDYGSRLWAYMLHVLDDLAPQSPRVFERTLLFACERLHRQESVIRPALAAGCAVLAPFFTMAASVYQEVEGVTDRRVIDIVETLLLRPDAILYVRSDPELAASRAVRRRPLEGEFYNQYDDVESFARALQLHDSLCHEYRARGTRVLTVECTSEESVLSNTIQSRDWLSSLTREVG